MTVWAYMVTFWLDDCVKNTLQNTTLLSEHALFSLIHLITCAILNNQWVELERNDFYISGEEIEKS